jgi:two-component system KDP operon response regulator KdpE
LTILVIEDEIQVAEMIERVLERLGNRCVRACNTEVAEQLLARTCVDAVTLDLGMPGRGGLPWLEQVAAARPQIARRTLVITGQQLDAESVERVARCGAGVLAKPFTLANLSDALRGQVGRDAVAAPRD